MPPFFWVLLAGESGMGWGQRVRKYQQLSVNLEDQLVKQPSEQGLGLKCNHWLLTCVIRKAAEKGLVFLMQASLDPGFLL